MIEVRKIPSDLQFLNNNRPPGRHRITQRQAAAIKTKKVKAMKEALERREEGLAGTVLDFLRMLQQEEATLLIASQSLDGLKSSKKPSKNLKAVILTRTSKFQPTRLEKLIPFSIITKFELLLQRKRQQVKHFSDDGWYVKAHGFGKYSVEQVQQLCAARELAFQIDALEKILAKAAEFEEIKTELYVKDKQLFDVFDLRFPPDLLKDASNSLPVAKRFSFGTASISLGEASESLFDDQLMNDITIDFFMVVLAIRNVGILHIPSGIIRIAMEGRDTTPLRNSLSGWKERNNCSPKYIILTVGFEEKCHWGLIMVNVDTKNVIFFDPMHPNDRLQQEFHDWVAPALKIVFGLAGIRKSLMELPIQEDSVSCGVYICGVAACLSMNIDPCVCNTNTIHFIRHCIFHDIVATLHSFE